MNTAPPQPSIRSGRYQNTMLTAIAVFLALGLVERSSQTTVESSAAGPAAYAQPPAAGEPGGLLNALEQRKQIIAELRAIAMRLERIEARLRQRLDVRVVDMPPMRPAPEQEQTSRLKPPDPAPATAPNP